MSSKGPGRPASETPSHLPGQITRLLQEVMAAPDASLVPASEVGDRIGRFLLVRAIGRGGFGLVFEAEDTHLRRRVAIKVLRPERGSTPTTAEWIRREGEAAARVHHPTVVTLHDVGQWEGGTYLVYELLEGETLADRLEAGPLDRREARRVLRSIAVGLAQMHAAGVVHRDLKPDNVFIETDGNVKILDLGLAQVAGAVGMVAGSPPYVAPEQWRGEATDARADVYAWGILARKVLTGKSTGPSPESSPSSVHSLRTLVSRARSQDPGPRPVDGSALVAELDRIDCRKRRAALLAGAAVALAVVGAFYGLGRALKPSPGAPTGPFRVAVADAENGSGKPALDGVGDLVARGLQSSPRLQVLDRARLVGVLRASGRSAPERLDRGIARFAARQAGGAAVLVPSAAEDGDAIALGVEALEPETGRVLFTVRERAGSEADVLPAVNRIVGRVREALRDREPEVRGADQEVTRAVSSSLLAHQHYLAGVRCVERPSDGSGGGYADCERHFRKALDIDPEFPLAHFELVRLAWWAAAPYGEIRPMLDSALRRVDLLAPREQALVRAWDATLSPRPERSVEILQAAVQDSPDDPRLTYALAEALFRQGRTAESIPHLERAMALDPGFELAVDSLVWYLGKLDRVEDLRRVAQQLAASPPSTGMLISEARARGFSGDVEGALQVVRRAAPSGKGLAREHLENALVAAGVWADAEAMLREDAARSPDGGSERLVRYLLLRGRIREAKAIRDRRPPPGDPHRRYLEGSQLVNEFLVPRRDLAAVRTIVDEVVATTPENAGSFAPALAYLAGGDAALALAGHPTVDPGTRKLVAALVTWRTSGPRAALEALRGLARGEPFTAELGPPDSISWYAAECAVEVASDEAALDALHRFQRFYYPLGQWRTWAYPRSLLLEASVLARLGRPEEARATLARLEDLLSGADADLPLLAEARALRRKLGPGPRVAATASDPGSRNRGGGGERMKPRSKSAKLPSREPYTLAVSGITANRQGDPDDAVRARRHRPS